MVVAELGLHTGEDSGRVAQALEQDIGQRQRDDDGEREDEERPQVASLVVVVVDGHGIERAARDQVRREVVERSRSE